LLNIPFAEYTNLIKNKDHYSMLGKVTQVIGLLIQVEGLHVFVEEVCEIYIKSSGKIVLAEVVGFKEQVCPPNASR